MNRALLVLTIILACLALSAGAQAQGDFPTTPPAEPHAAEDEGAATEGGEPRRIEIDLRSVLQQARAAVRAGELEEAVRLYQLILRFVPDARAARIELSFALAALGQQKRAARLLRDIDREGLDPEVIATIDRVVGPGPLTFFVIPELIFDSNINEQTKNDIILINGTPLRLSEEAKGRDGVGYGLTAGVAYRFIDEAPRSTITLGGRIRDLSQSRDDESSVFGSLSFAFDVGERTTVIPSVSGAYRWDAHQPREVEGAAALSSSFDVGPVRTTLTGRYRTIDGEGDFEDLLDRKRYEIDTALGYGFPGLGLRFDGGVFREDWTPTETQDNDGFEAGLDFIFVKVPVIMPTVGGAFTLTSFENEANFFGVKRLDRDYEGRLELLFRDIDLFGAGPPVLRYTYTHATSNIPLFDFNEHEVSVGIRAITF